MHTAIAFSVLLRFLPFLGFAFCFLTITRAPLAYADIKIIYSEATYVMGDGETPSFAEAMALQKAKQRALEEAGTYVESYSRTKNQDLTKDEIQTLAGGMLQAEILEKSRTLVSEGLYLSIKIKATVTTDNMEELANRIKGKNVAEEYKNLRVKFEALTNEINELKRVIATNPSFRRERDAALNRIKEREREFTDLQQDEANLYERLVRGESLVTEAQKVLRLSDTVIRSMLGPGLSIAVGEVRPKILRDSPEMMEVDLEIAITPTDHLSAVLRQIAENRNASIDSGPVFPGDLRRFYPEKGKVLLPAQLFRFSATPEIREELWHLRRSLKNLDLLIEFLGPHGRLDLCRQSYGGAHLIPGVQVGPKDQAIPFWSRSAIRDEAVLTAAYFGSEHEFHEHNHLYEILHSYFRSREEESKDSMEEDFPIEISQMMKRMGELQESAITRWLNAHAQIMRIKEEDESKENIQSPTLLVVSSTYIAPLINMASSRSLKVTMDERTLKQLRKITARLDLVRDSPRDYMSWKSRYRCEMSAEK